MRTALVAPRASLTDLERLEHWARCIDDHAVTPGHAMRVADFSARLAIALGWSPERTEQLRRAALLHDLGKLALPRDLLTQTGALSPRDRAVLQIHPRLGARLAGVAPTQAQSLTRVVALHHHEAWDGSGYPDGLRGDEIPLEARIVCIADVFDALVSRRPYKPAWSPSQAMRIMRANAGTHFDPRLLEVFLNLSLG
jgi:putative two-component system response regulator